VTQTTEDASLEQHARVEGRNPTRVWGNNEDWSEKDVPTRLVAGAACAATARARTVIVESILVIEPEPRRED
jgi:hypothetical protein